MALALVFFVDPAPKIPRAPAEDALSVHKILRPDRPQCRFELPMLVGVLCRGCVSTGVATIAPKKQIMRV